MNLKFNTEKEASYELAKDLTPEGEQVVATLNELLLMTEQELEELRQ